LQPGDAPAPAWPPTHKLPWLPCTSKKTLSCSLDHCPLLCQCSARDESIESERYHVTYNGDFNTFEVLGFKEPQVNPDINVIEVPGA